MIRLEYRCDVPGCTARCTREIDEDEWGSYMGDKPPSDDHYIDTMRISMRDGWTLVRLDDPLRDEVRCPEHRAEQQTTQGEDG